LLRKAEDAKADDAKADEAEADEAFFATMAGMASHAVERSLLTPRWSGNSVSDFYPWLEKELAAREPSMELEIVALRSPDKPDVE
jgi:hypothetical protein